MIERLESVARETGSSVARVALAWVQHKPGVVSSIIGARTMAQLRDNLGALSVSLTPTQIAFLDEGSQPQLNFPHDFLARAAGVMQGGTTINGRSVEPWPLSPENDSERW